MLPFRRRPGRLDHPCPESPGGAARADPSPSWHIFCYVLGYYDQTNSTLQGQRLGLRASVPGPAQEGGACPRLRGSPKEGLARGPGRVPPQDQLKKAGGRSGLSGRGQHLEILGRPDPRTGLHTISWSCPCLGGKDDSPLGGKTTLPRGGAGRPGLGRRRRRLATDDERHAEDPRAGDEQYDRRDHQNAFRPGRRLR